MTVLGMALGCAIFAVLYVFSRVELTTGEDAIWIRWVVLGAVPFGSRTLRTSDTEGVEPYSFKRHWNVRAQFFGRIWPAPYGRILIRLDGSRFQFIRGYVLALDDPDALARSLPGLDDSGRR